MLACALVCMLATAVHANLENEINSVIQGQNLGQTKAGVFIWDVTDNELLARLNPDEPMIPASNMKLYTTAAALAILGPDFRFTTQLRFMPGRDATQGTLVVHGDGDPAFCDPVLLREHGFSLEDILNRWVESVRNTGVTRIDRLVIDDGTFDDAFTHPHWPRDQLSRRYCAQVSGLNFYGNTLDFYPSPTAWGQTPDLTVYPPAPFITLINRAQTGDSDTFDIVRRDEANHFTFFGKVRNRRRTPVEVTVHDPSLTFGQVLAHQLGEAGIRVGSVTRPNPEEQFEGGRILQTYITPLPGVLRRTNKDSQNMFAEALLKRTGQRYTGAPGSWANGSAAMRDFLGRELGTVAVAARISDGSGLSRENRITANLTVRLLRNMHQKDHQRVVRAVQLGLEPDRLFRDSFAIGGEDGTLRNRLRNTTATVYAKSGFINQVTCLSGYLVYTLDDGKDEDGRTVREPREHVVAFSMLFNDYRAPVSHATIRDLQDRLVVLIDRRTREKLEARQAQDAAVQSNAQ